MTTENQTMTRPPTMTWFKRIMVASLLLGLLALPLSWYEVSRVLDAESLSQYTTAIMPWVVLWQLVLFAVIYVIVALIADEGRTIPKWLFIIGYLGGTALLLAGVPGLDPNSLAAWVALVQIVPQGLAVLLLFTPSAREWFAHQRSERAAKAAAASAAPSAPAA